MVVMRMNKAFGNNQYVQVVLALVNNSAIVEQVLSRTSVCVWGGRALLTLKLLCMRRVQNTLIAHICHCR